MMSRARFHRQGKLAQEFLSIFFKPSFPKISKMAACTEYLIYSISTAQGYELLHCTPQPKGESIYTYIFDSFNMLKSLTTLSFGFS